MKLALAIGIASAAVLFGLAWDLFGHRSKTPKPTAGPPEGTPVDS